MWKDIPPAWTRADGPESDIVISTRARLARNLSGIPFPGRASAEDLEKAAKRVLRAGSGLEIRWPDLQIVEIAGLSEENRSFLIDAHLASPQQVLPRKSGFVFLEPGGRIAIMVNEEDHLRIQTILPGLAPIASWQLADEIDDELAGALTFACSGRLGYLTASLSNVGTGLRMSAMMHLAGLAAVRRLGQTLRAAIDLGVSVRGIFGEGSQGLGDLYQVSNEVTLGATEREYVERVRAVSEHILGEERNAREEVMCKNRMQLLMAARGSMARLRAAETVSAGEAMKLLSPIRLASALGLVESITTRLLNELMVAMRVMRVQTPDDYASRMDDRRRAVLVRRRLRGIEI